MTRLQRVLAVLLLLASFSAPASAQVAQPTGCPAPYTGNVCLGSGGSDLDVIIGAGGPAIVFSRSSKQMTLVNGWVPVSWPFTTPVLTDPTITVSSGSLKLGLPSQAAGDLLYADAATTYTRLAKAAAGQVLVSGTAPAWSASPTLTKLLVGDGTVGAPAFTFSSNPTDGIYLSTTSHMPILVSNGVAMFGWRDPSTNGLVMNGGYPLCFSTGAPASQGCDTYFRRSATKTLTIDADGAGAALTLVDVKGAVTSSSTVTGGGFTSTTGTLVKQSANSGIYSNSNGTLDFETNSGAIGVRWDFTVDGTSALQTTAGADTAILKSNKISATSAFVSGGSGMAVANVGANSCGTSAASIAGNNNAFKITVGATAGTQCRVAFTFAATTEWDCTVTDATTTIATRATPVDTTHTDFFGAFVAGDTVIGICFPR